MKFLKSPMAIVIALSAVLVGSQFLPVQADEEATPNILTVGSKAPALNIEHWVQDGSGKYAPVTEFEAGKVYVVEFWATWCGPCIMSMPHLAETQEKYAEKGVQLVSVSDEDLETVEKFLEREVRGSEDGSTYKQLTSVYCLTTDPDESTHKSYMEAARQNGIPTAFIVGKSGEVEWIGHPMSMDEPLEAVVAGTWDRDAFRKEFEASQKFDIVQMEVFQAMQAGETKKALSMLDEFAAENPGSPVLANLGMMKLQIALRSGDNELVSPIVADMLKSAAGDAEAVNQAGWMLHQISGQIELPEGTLATARDAVAAEIEKADDSFRPMILDTLAALQADTGMLKEAIETQERAVAEADGAEKEQLTEFLEELKARIAEENGDDK